MKVKIAFVVLLAILAGGGVGFYIGRESNSSLQSDQVQLVTPTPTSSSSPTPTPTPSPSPTPTPVQLLCFDTSKGSLRSSDVIAGCFESERSLGASEFLVPEKNPTELNHFLKTRFMAAQAAAKREGHTLVITSGFRSYEHQAFLYKAAVKKYGSAAIASRWVLPPDISHHPMGLAIDVNYPKGRLSAGWLDKNGYKYGLCRAYDYEWWHFEGLSVPGQPCPPMLSDASATVRE